METRDVVRAGLIATAAVIAGCSSHATDPSRYPMPESAVSQPPAAAPATPPQEAPATGAPGSGSNGESVGRLNCATLRSLGVNAQSVSTIVDGTMQVNPGMSKDAATADLVNSVHLYCPQFDDELKQATGS